MSQPVACPSRKDARATPSTKARAGGSLVIVVISQSTPLVVGVDGSERSRDALALAAGLADPGQQLLLTRVHDYGRLSILLGLQSANDALRAALDEQLSEAIAPLGDGCDAASLVVDGDAAIELTEASAELDLLGWVRDRAPTTPITT